MYQIGNACSFIGNKGYFSRYLWMTSKWLKEAEYGSYVDEIDEKTLILENLHHFLAMYTWDALNMNAIQMKRLLNNVKICLNHVFLLEQLKITIGAKRKLSKHYSILN